MPSLSVTSALEQIFRSTLSIEPPPPGTDLIATGLLDSLSVVTLLVEMEKHFGVTVRMEEIDLDNLRTLDRLVALVESAQNGHDEPPPAPTSPLDGLPVIPLRDGSGPPLFIVHMIGGGVAMLRRLALALDTERPIFGLQARGLQSSEQPRRTVEEMAEAYCDAIEVVQPGGPYALCGYSFGGLVAFEMACQLARRGREVAFLALIDPEAHPEALPRAALWRFRVAMPFRVLRHILARPRERIPEYARMAARRIVPAAKRAAPIHEQPIASQYVRVAGAATRAAQLYRPGFYDGGAELFVAQERRLSACDPQDVWSYRVRGGLAINQVPGRHADLFARENIGPLATSVTAALRRT